jgi:GAF domain-containing protein
MPARPFVLPDERFASLLPAVDERVRTAARMLTAESFPNVLDTPVRHTLLRGFEASGADEGTVWLADEPPANLVAAFNSGPRAEEIVLHYVQSLAKGMISLVFASEQPICENAVYKNERQDKKLDQKLGVLTVAMMAVPLYFGRELRGVVSCVKLKDAEVEADPTPFSPDDLRTLQAATDALSRLIDHRLLSASIGWGEL